jgi:hypothetical protein
MKQWLLLGVVASCSVACNSASGGVKGSGTARTETRAVSGFTAIEAGGALDLKLSIGPAPRLEITGDDNIVPLIETKVVGDKLVIRSTRSYSINRALRVTVVAPRLTALDLSGSGDAELRGLKEDALALTVSGAATVRAYGAVQQLTLDVHGSGDVALDQMPVERASIRVTGAAEATLTVHQSLDVHITGSGTVKYHGDPTVTKEVTGSGELKKW